MWPHGDPKRAYPLGSFTITNTGKSTDPKVGDYIVRFWGAAGQALPSRLCTVSNWKRLTKPVMSLVRQALEHGGF